MALTLLAVDTLGLIAAFGLAYLVRFRAGVSIVPAPPAGSEGSFDPTVVCVAVVLWLALFGVFRLYDHRSLFTGLSEYVRIANACTAGVVGLILISFVTESLVLSRGWLAVSWVATLVIATSLRFTVRRVVRLARARGALSTPTLIVGSNDEGAALAEQLLHDRSSGARVLGFVDSSLPVGTPVIDGLVVVSPLENVQAALKKHGVRQIVVATSALSRQQLLDLYRAVGLDEQVELRLSSGLFEILTTGLQVQEISSIPLIAPHRTRVTGMDSFLKASVDYLAALSMLIVLSPVMLVVAVLIRLDSPGPIIHRRRVLGVGGKAFDAFKFRTMVADADQLLLRDQSLRAAFEHGYKLKDDPRITQCGRILRRTSLDELPQLLNVLRGEMSLVGPRMIAPEESERYGKWRFNLLTVKPGITGPWQVEGRSDLPYEQRVQLSMQYIRNYSLWLDLAILLRTVALVVRGRGAY